MAEKEYIEREAAYKACEAYFSGVCVYDVSASEVINDFENVIEAVPTSDVAPIRHGHWYNRGGRFRCSVCDNKALLKDIGGTGGWSHEYEQQKSPYCPHCGAKMDGGEGE